MWLLVYVALWLLLRGVSCWVILCPLSSCFLLLFFSVLFSIVITSLTSLGEEGAGQYVSRTFVYFVHVNVCPFSLPLGVRDWLRLVIVTLPGLFINFFYNSWSLNNHFQLKIMSVLWGCANILLFFLFLRINFHLTISQYLVVYYFFTPCGLSDKSHLC